MLLPNEPSYLEMPTTDLYLIRHGETEYNRRRIVQGRRIDARLNPTGLAQAEALAARFAATPLDAIYASTLVRAKQTAAAIAARHPSVPVRHLRDLEEMSWGVYEGEPPSERVRGAFAAMYEAWGQGEFGIPVEGGESILDVQARGLRATRAIMAEHPGETVAVVAHGRFLRVVLASLLPEYGLARMHELEHANTCVNHLTWDGTRCTARLLNCTAHLDAVETIMVE